MSNSNSALSRKGSGIAMKLAEPLASLGFVLGALCSVFAILRFNGALGLFGLLLLTGGLMTLVLLNIYKATNQIVEVNEKILAKLNSVNNKM